MKGKYRIQYIDRLKGLAILLVVIQHIFTFSYGEPASVSCMFIKSFRMPLFIFMSGYVITALPDTRKTIRKLVQFLVPMTVFGIVYAFYYQGISITGIGNWQLTIAKFFMSPTKMGYWYLFILALFYVTLTAFRLNGKKRFIADLALSIAIWLLFLIGWRTDNILTDSFCLQYATFLYPFFVAGHFMRKYNRMNTIINHDRLFVVCLISYAILFSIDLPTTKLNLVSVYFIQPVFSLPIILWLFLRREQQTSAAERMLAYIGRNTLDVYVIHYFFIAAIHLEAVSNYFIETENSLLAFALAAILSIPITFLSIFIGKTLRQNPLLRKYAFGQPL